MSSAERRLVIVLAPVLTVLKVTEIKEEIHFCSLPKRLFSVAIWARFDYFKNKATEEDLVFAKRIFARSAKL